MRSIPTLKPELKNDRDHGRWIDLEDYSSYMSESDLHSQAEGEGAVLLELEAAQRKNPAGMALKLDGLDLTTDLLEQLSHYPIVSLGIEDCTFEDDFDFNVFAKFKDLRELFIDDHNDLEISQEDLKPICELINLQALKIVNAGIRRLPQELSNLQKLRYLNLENNQIENLDIITSLKNLRYLNLMHYDGSMLDIQSVPEAIK